MKEKQFTIYLPIDEDDALSTLASEKFAKALERVGFQLAGESTLVGARKQKRRLQALVIDWQRLERFCDFLESLSPPR